MLKALGKFPFRLLTYYIMDNNGLEVFACT
jgi:hypothetical protein